MGAGPALLRCHCATLQPDPPKPNLRGPEFYQRKLRSRMGSSPTHAYQGRLPVVFAGTFPARKFSEVALRIFCSHRSLLMLGTQLCSLRQELCVDRVSVLNFGLLRNLIGSTTSATASAAFINKASSQSSATDTIHAGSNDVTTDSQPQRCPVCAAASTSSCFCCDQHFCGNHIYPCVECGDQYCGECLDAHHADGHWGDSDTAAELAQAHCMNNRQVGCQLDLSLSGAATFDQSTGRFSLTAPLTTFRSLLTLMFPRYGVLQAEAC